MAFTIQEVSQGLKEGRSFRHESKMQGILISDRLDPHNAEKIEHRIVWSKDGVSCGGGSILISFELIPYLEKDGWEEIQ